MRSEQFEVRRQLRRFGLYFRQRLSMRGCPWTLPPNSKFLIAACAIALLMLSSALAGAQQLSRDQWGGVPVTVTHQNQNWIIAGKRQKVTLNERSLAIDIEAGAARWSTAGSSTHDLLVRT